MRRSGYGGRSCRPRRAHRRVALGVPGCRACTSRSRARPRPLAPRSGRQVPQALGRARHDGPASRLLCRRTTCANLPRPSRRVSGRDEAAARPARRGGRLRVQRRRRARGQRRDPRRCLEGDVRRVHLPAGRTDRWLVHAVQPAGRLPDADPRQVAGGGGAGLPGQPGDQPSRRTLRRRARHRKPCAASPTERIARCSCVSSNTASGPTPGPVSTSSSHRTLG